MSTPNCVAFQNGKQKPVFCLQQRQNKIQSQQLHWHAGVGDLRVEPVLPMEFHGGAGKDTASRISFHRDRHPSFGRGSREVWSAKGEQVDAMTRLSQQHSLQKDRRHCPPGLVRLLSEPFATGESPQQPCLHLAHILPRDKALLWMGGGHCQHLTVGSQLWALFIWTWGQVPTRI
jgi:hypothetical protein